MAMREFFEPFGRKDDIVVKVSNWILGRFASQEYQDTLAHIIHLGKQSADLDIAISEIEEK